MSRDIAGQIGLFVQKNLKKHEKFIIDPCLRHKSLRTIMNILKFEFKFLK
jgi:hypothetical protein